jgi:hypothetical protein
LDRGPISEPRRFGAALDFKFAQIEKILDLDPTSVIVHFFVPPKQFVKSRLLGSEACWNVGTEMVITRRELHLFSDDKDGYRQLYGFRASWVPLQNVREMEWDEVSQLIVIRLAGGLSLNVSVLQDWRTEAKNFLEFTARHTG